MSALTSGKVWVYQVVGTVPPGVSDADMRAMVMTTVSWAAQMLPLMRQHGFNVLAETDVPRDLRGPGVSLS